MKVVAIIQARMGSSRLPGKVLKQVLGKELLTYQLERVSRSKYMSDVIVATTNNNRDKEIVSLCKSLDILYYTGPEEDVLKRYYMAAQHVNADVVIRLTGDCPIIDPELIDRITETYLLHNPKYQLVTNTLERTFPRGMDIEVFSLQVLKEAHKQAVSKPDREHVTRYIVNHPESFSLLNVSNSRNDSHYRWTVDTMEDFILIKKIIESLYPQNRNFTMEDTINLLAEYPEWQLINKHVQQKKD
ncbi:cytidylyltransferase domain-containing protein [Ornithinibacillus salinisoli]|uniref:Cytidylyltransferase domain-containing protein n=1 Tax=Ornithinibacillus salinisoli TaxID=1848459 RepID=A0ABW4W4L3_9BACI